MTARVQRGRCPSGKVRYRNEPAAIAYRSVRYLHADRTGQRTPELYVYRCRLCNGWHLTKQQPRGPVPDQPDTPPTTG